MRGTFRGVGSAGEIPEPHKPSYPGRDARAFETQREFTAELMVRKLAAGGGSQLRTRL